MEAATMEKSIFFNWPYKWFGFWKEMGDSYRLCPSVLDFVDDKWEPVDKSRMIQYLLKAQPVSCTSRVSAPCVFDGPLCRYDKTESDFVCLRTDGVWSWMDDLDHYILHHNVRVPDALTSRMILSDYVPLSLLDVHTANLEQPPLLRSQNSTPYAINEAQSELLTQKIREEANNAYEKQDHKEAMRLYSLIRERLDQHEKTRLDGLFESILPYLISLAASDEAFYQG